jgi:hypothetical protein
MKLNFWQWLGIIIVVIALIFIIRRETAERGGVDRAPNPAPEFSPEQAVEKPTTAPADPTTGPAAP